MPFVRISPIDTAAAFRATKFSHSLGLPTANALILAACLGVDCTEFWATDRQLLSPLNNKASCKSFGCDLTERHE